MKKSDLKSGMVVEYQNGSMRIVIGDSLYTIQNNKLLVGSLLSSFNNNLICYNTPGLSIQKVYRSVTAYNSPHNKERYLIWERYKWEDVKKDTLVEVIDEDYTFYRYFSKYKNGKVYLFVDGATSYTTDLDMPYNPSQVRIAELQEEF